MQFAQNLLCQQWIVLILYILTYVFEMYIYSYRIPEY